MDRAALRSVERQAGIPPSIARLPEAAAGLLVEFQAEGGTPAASLETRAASAVGGLRLLDPPASRTPRPNRPRSGGSARGCSPRSAPPGKRGTAVLIEDVAFPVDRLADAVTDLRPLFGRHGYDDAIIFGHAKDGNLHFVLSQSFNDEAAVGAVRAADGRCRRPRGRAATTGR